MSIECNENEIIEEDSSLNLTVQYIRKVRPYITNNYAIPVTEEPCNPREILETDSILPITEEHESVSEVIQFTVLSGEEIITKEIPLKKLAKKNVIFKRVSDSRQKFIREIVLNNRKYYLFIKKGSLFISPKLRDVIKIKQNLFALSLRKAICFWGIITNTSGKDICMEDVYLGDKNYCRIIRPFKRWKFKHFALIKIAKDDILDLDQMHSGINLSNGQISIALTYKRKKGEGMQYIIRNKYKNEIILLRTTFGGTGYMITHVPYEKEYSKACMFKNFCARILAPFYKHKKINLMFEKETMTAKESGYYIFEKIIAYCKNNGKRCNTYFILSGDSPQFEEVKGKYGKHIVKKYTLRHYIYIYASRYFISSELSNHSINPRIYIKSINEVVRKKPLVFLQHGIMFAKPVENPAARGFYKKSKSVNVYKSVICSDLEAEQFYKMGYGPDDLLKVGLPKFDVSYMSEKADKIMFMPTYRYWEEALIFNPDKIKTTTYYNLCMNVIREFEKNNLLDKLIICCHPKFAEIIEEIGRMKPEYGNIIETNVNQGLENARIFITDFSSASYDAHYRGAYIIYDWEEKDYLIENYQAVPPINEDNCDGVPVFNVKQLVEEVKRAIRQNYVMDEVYEERYKKINEFHDGKNGDRLINELVRLEILEG